MSLHTCIVASVAGGIFVASAVLVCVAIRDKTRWLNEQWDAMLERHRREQEALGIFIARTQAEVDRLTEQRRRYEEYRRWQRRGPWARTGGGP